jgi:hypothetical protein
MAAIFVSGREEYAALGVGGRSAVPMLFDDVPILEGVGNLYDAPNRLPPFKRLLFTR